MIRKILLAGVVLSIGVMFFLNDRKEEKLSGISATDPEFSALWENFIKNDVLPKNTFDEQMRYRLILASNIATQSFGLYENTVQEALDKGLPATEIKEILYQSVPYVGYGKAFDFILVTNEIFKERGIDLPLKGQSTTTPEQRFSKGLALQTGIFGNVIAEGFKSAPKDELHIREYLSSNCFGDYYTRGDLGLKTRELLTFVMLVSMGGADSQVKSHVQGNVNIGNGRDVLISAITQILPYIGYPRSLNGLAAVDAIVPPQNSGENK